MICLCVRHRPVESNIPESQSWVTARAKEVTQNVDSWSPEGHSEDGLGSMANLQVDARQDAHTADLTLDR